MPPNKGCTLGDFEGIKQSLIGELRDHAHALAAIVIGFLEGSDFGLFLIKFGRERCGRQMVDVGEDCFQHALIVGFSRRGEIDLHFQRTVVGRAFPNPRFHFGD